MNEYEQMERQLCLRLIYNDLVLADYPVICYLEEFEKSSISSMRIFRLMMEDVFSLLSIKEFTMESGDAVYQACQGIMNQDRTRGFLPVNKRSDMWFPCALVPLWIVNCFEYKNKGSVNQVPTNTQGLLSNMRIIQCALYNVCFNLLCGPLSKKEKEIEKMYFNEYGILFRQRTDKIKPEKEAELLIRATNSCGFYYKCHGNGSLDTSSFDMPNMS